MKFDYMDEKCPKCGHRDLKWVYGMVIYNLFYCKECDSTFRVTTAEAPDITPETGHKVTMLPDTCANCGEKQIKYSYSRSMRLPHGEYIAWDYFLCDKCGVKTQVGLYGDIVAL